MVLKALFQFSLIPSLGITSNRNRLRAAGSAHRSAPFEAGFSRKIFLPQMVRNEVVYLLSSATFRGSNESVPKAIYRRFHIEKS